MIFHEPEIEFRIHEAVLADVHATNKVACLQFVAGPTDQYSKSLLPVISGLDIG